jgi:hypothetical protein
MNRMLEDDSSPLDGQQEKTRAYHTPVVRQQGFRAAVHPCPQFRKLSNWSLHFSRFVVIFILGHCVSSKRGRPSAVFLFLAVL